MSIFDALSGRIGYSNSIIVPIYNEISRNIQKTCTGVEESFFGIVSLAGIAQKMIDLIFKPGPNSFIKTIREYNQNDIRNLYSIFMTWALHDLINLSELDSRNELKLRNKLKNILSLDNDKFNYYFNNLKHEKKLPIGLDKLWKQVPAKMCSECETEAFVDRVLFAEGLYNSLVYMGGCYQLDAITKVLTKLQALCDFEDCNC